MKTVLISVLASSGLPYPSLVQASQATWDSQGLAGTDSFYFFDRDFKHSWPQCVTVPESGALNACGRRAMLGLRWALDHKSWDYLARVNASCYVRKPVLLEYCQNIPTANLFRGVGATGPYGRFLWGGANFILSRDAAEMLVRNAHRLHPTDMEDVALSELAKKIGLPLDIQGNSCSLNWKGDHWLCISYTGGKQGGFEFRDVAEMAKSGQHFIRVKQDLRRNRDIELMKALHAAGI